MPRDAYGYPLAEDKNGQRLRPHSLVRYAPRPGEWEYGMIVSINADYVFVHFFGVKQSKACRASDLEKG